MPPRAGRRFGPRPTQALLVVLTVIAVSWFVALLLLRLGRLGTDRTVGACQRIRSSRSAERGYERPCRFASIIYAAMSISDAARTVEVWQGARRLYATEGTGPRPARYVRDY
jgi:hypothetical protein